ncbi:MAG TPA: hypothetical protein VGO62_14295, partial [Myxococcota bacterium]
KWTASPMSGCAYADSREVFVKIGGKLRAAAAYLGDGHNGKAAPEASASTCAPAAPAKRA